MIKSLLAGAVAGVALAGTAGLNPRPPRLSKLAAQRTPEKAFCVIRNGVRQSGLPAFGPTRADAELWQLVAFLSQAGDLDAAGYDALVTRARRLPAGDGHAHRHGPSDGEPQENAGDAGAAAGGHDHPDGDDAHAH